MKHVLLLILSLLLFSQSFAQKYQIYSFDQKVKVKKIGSQWQSAKQRMILKDGDSVMIYKNASIILLEASSNQIFEWKEQGRFKVSYIIKECRTRKANWFSRLFATLYENFTGEQPPLYWPTGVTRRGDNDYPLEHALAKKLKDYNSDRVSADTMLTAEIVSLGKDAFYLNIKNNTSEILFINVLVNNTKEASPGPILLYNINKNQEKWMMLPVKPHSDLPLSDFVISKNEGIEYIVFGTTKPFSIKPFDSAYREDTTNDINSNESENIIIGTIVK